MRFQIGKLAELAGSTVDTIRYYEKRGLIPPPPRSTGNQRLYSSDDVERLQFIQRCRELEFSLEETRVLLQYLDGPERNKDVVRSLVRDHLAKIESQLSSYQSLATTLSHLLEDPTTPSDEAILRLLREGPDSLERR